MHKIATGNVNINTTPSHEDPTEILQNTKTRQNISPSDLTQATPQPLKGTVKFEGRKDKSPGRAVKQKSINSPRKSKKLMDDSPEMRRNES